MDESQVHTPVFLSIKILGTEMTASRFS